MIDKTEFHVWQRLSLSDDERVIVERENGSSLLTYNSQGRLCCCFRLWDGNVSKKYFFLCDTKDEVIMLSRMDYASQFICYDRARKLELV